jgi:cell division protein FtsW (lipid II flippase)
LLYRAETAAAVRGNLRSSQLRTWMLRLIACIALLMVFGALTSFTTTVYMRIAQGRPPYSDFIQHLVFYALGIGAAVGLTVVFRLFQPVRRWLRIVIPLSFFLSLLLVAMVKLTPLGVDWMGSTRHLNLGFVVFQPSELLKITVVLYIAQLLCWWRRMPEGHADAAQPDVADAQLSSLERRRRRALNQASSEPGEVLPTGWLAEARRFFTPSVRSARPRWPELPRRILLLLLLAVGMTAIQPDLGSAAIIMAAGVIAVLIAGVSMRQVAFCALVVAGIALLLLFAAPGHYNYAQKRINTWLNPLENSDSAAYQITQSRGALAVGEWFGRGYLKSDQKMNRLPLSTKDFVYPIVVEELGYIGGVAVILLFLGVAWTGSRLAMLCRKPFNQTVIAALSLTICLQGFVNIGTTIGTLPLSGLTLPFFSAGGTSIFVTLLAIGTILALALEEQREARREECQRSSA